MESVPTSSEKREYMTGLMKHRSIAALCNGIFELLIVFYALVVGLNITVEVYGDNIWHSYRYFTMISNTIAAVSVAFIIPYAVEGIRNKRFILPRWNSVLFFSSVTSITVVMLFTLLFISWASPKEAFGGSNAYLHICCPILILTSFFQIESGYKYTLKDCLFACVPFTIYLIVYTVMVIFIGEEKGGWPDIYRVTEFLPPFVTIPLMLGFCFGTSLLLAKLSNLLTAKRKEKLFCYWKEDVQPLEAKIEAYGLGVAAAKNMEKENIQIPYDILEELSNRYNIESESLLKCFIKGLEVELKKGN